MKNTMEHPHTKDRKVVKQGYSWTVLLFRVFVTLIRGDIAYFFIMILLAMLTFGLSWLVMPFIYNGIYIKKLREKGYLFVK